VSTHLYVVHLLLLPDLSPNQLQDLKSLDCLLARGAQSLPGSEITLELGDLLLPLRPLLLVSRLENSVVVLRQRLADLAVALLHGIGASTTMQLDVHPNLNNLTIHHLLNEWVHRARLPLQIGVGARKRTRHVDGDRQILRLLRVHGPTGTLGNVDTLIGVEVPLPGEEAIRLGHRFSITILVGRVQLGVEEETGNPANDITHVDRHEALH